MPRRHRRIDVTPPREGAETTALVPAAAGLDADIVAAAQGLLQVARLLDLRGRGALGHGRRVALRHRWARTTPAQAQRLAQLLALEPALFAPLPFDAAALLTGEERVRRLHRVKELLDHLSDQAADLLLLEKATLHERVQLGVAAAESLLAGPLTDPAVKRRLRPRAEPLLRGIAARRSAIRRKKRASLRLRGLDRSAPSALR